jgi:hypothetical protein
VVVGRNNGETRLVSHTVITHTSQMGLPSIKLVIRSATTLPFASVFPRRILASETTFAHAMNVPHSRLYIERSSQTTDSPLTDASPIGSIMDPSDHRSYHLTDDKPIIIF